MTVGRLDADVLLASGRWREALDHYDALLAADGDESLARAELLRGRAEALCRLHRGREAIDPAREAAELFEARRDLTDAAWARYWQAVGHLLDDDPPAGRELLLRLLAAGRGGLAVAPDFRFRLLVMLGNADAWDGQPDRALTYMEEARSLLGFLSLSQQAAFLAGLALHYRMVGDFEASIREGEESLALYRSLDAEQEEVSVETNLALNFIDLGNTSRAESLLARASEVGLREGDQRLISDVAEAEARLALARGDAERTIERAAAALGAAASGGSYLVAVGAHQTLARLALIQHDRPEAEKRFAAAAELLRTHDARSRPRDLLAEWARMRSDVGDPEGANALYVEALGRRALRRPA